MHGLHFLKTQIFDLIARHILEKIFDTQELSSEDMWWGSLFIIDLWHEIIFHIGSASEKYRWMGNKIKKSSMQRYRVSCSGKTATYIVLVFPILLQKC